MRRAISIGLLLILTVTLVPRQVWHHCEHGFDHNTLIEAFSAADDCGICDYVFSAAANFNQNISPHSSPSRDFISQLILLHSSAELASLPDGRAPPIEV